MFKLDSLDKKSGIEHTTRHRIRLLPHIHAVSGLFTRIRPALAAVATLFFLAVGAAAQQLPPAPGPIPPVRRGADGRIELAPSAQEPAAPRPFKRQPETRSAAPPAVASANGAGCGTTRIGEIAVATRNNVPFVTLLANGVPVILLLDTGAERTVLTPPAAQRIGAQPPRIEFDRRMSGIGGALPTREVELRSFTIGGVAIPWRRIVVAPATLPSMFDGLLGTDVLSSFDVDVDLAHHRMLLHEKQSCPGATPNWAEPYVDISTGRTGSGYLFFPVHLDGRAIVAIVDTGATMTALSGKAALAFGVSDTVLARDQSITIRGATGELVSGHIHRFSQLEVGGETIRDPEIIVADVNLRDTDLVLGFDFVRSQRMWFSYGSRRIFLSRPRR
jgi:predicted aspartyl protease